MYDQKKINAKMELLDIVTNHSLEELNKFHDQISNIWRILGDEIARSIFIEEGKEEFLENNCEILL